MRARPFSCRHSPVPRRDSIRPGTKSPRESPLEQADGSSRCKASSGCPGSWPALPVGLAAEAPLDFVRALFLTIRSTVGLVVNELPAIFGTPGFQGFASECDRLHLTVRGRLRIHQRWSTARSAFRPRHFGSFPPGRQVPHAIANQSSSQLPKNLPMSPANSVSSLR